MLIKKYRVEYMIQRGSVLYVPASIGDDVSVLWDNEGLVGLVPEPVIKNGVSIAECTQSNSFTVQWEQVIPVTHIHIAQFFHQLPEHGLNNPSNHSDTSGEGGANAEH